MARLPWLVGVLLVQVACGGDDGDDDGEVGGSASCYYVPKAEVPRADYDAANADGELSPGECDALCRANIDEQQFDEASAMGAPDCHAQAVGASVVTVQCTWEIGCE